MKVNNNKLKEHKYSIIDTNVSKFILTETKQHIIIDTFESKNINWKNATINYGYTSKQINIKWNKTIDTIKLK